MPPHPRPLGGLPHLYCLQFAHLLPKTHLVAHKSQFRTHYEPVNRGEARIMMMISTVTDRGKVPPIDAQRTVGKASAEGKQWVSFWSSIGAPSR